MNDRQIRAILDDDITRALLEREPVMRIAYTGRDGAPRAVPLSYELRDGQFVFWTLPDSAKVAALRADPRVALTIDSPHPHLCCLLVRGTVAAEEVAGVPDDYLAASFRTMPAEQHEAFEQQVRGLYDGMTRFVLTPTFARLNDFQRTAPRAVEQLVARKS